jgi:hypothetical protein
MSAPRLLERYSPSLIASDYTTPLWLLKFGTLLNLYFLIKTHQLAARADPYIVLPAEILFAVSAYRCLFPTRYEHDVVLHDSILTSIFATRLFATFAEIGLIFLFSYVLRMLNVDHVGWIIVLSWLMVVQVVISQCFVWTAILTEELGLYVYEELGWAFIFAANTVISAYLYRTVGSAIGGGEVLLTLNLLFGIGYVPFEAVHLASLYVDARRNGRTSLPASASLSMRLAKGLWRSIRVKNRRTDPASWGGPVGLIWAIGYWAILIPPWIYVMVRVLVPR